MLALIAIEIWVFGTVCSWLLASTWRGRALAIGAAAITGFAAIYTFVSIGEAVSAFDRIR